MNSSPSQNENNPDAKLALPAGTILGDYRILNTLGQGGFGITYLAEHAESGERVVIKENMPVFCAWRDQTRLNVLATNPQDPQQEYPKLLTRFIEEAQLLAKLEHPNIIKVQCAFEALSTAYYVMPWVGGKELQQAAPPPGEITEEWLSPILHCLLDALAYLHSCNIYHRDVKPANILLTEEGTPILIDFGAARAIISERSATMVGSAGYSPIEQIVANGKRGPWTDVYSLGATCYRLITGSKPPESHARLAEENDPLILLAPQTELHSRFSVNFLASIDKALAQRGKDRWQTIGEWVEALANPTAQEAPVQPAPLESADADTEAPQDTDDYPEPEATTATVDRKSRRQSRSGKSGCVFLFIMLALGIGGGYYLYQQQEKSQPDQQPPVETTKKAPAPSREELAKQYELGERHFAAENYPEAVKYFTKAAEHGYPAAQFSLGFCHERALGVPQNFSQAIQLYSKAADQGFIPAICQLGVCAELGMGIDKDETMAANLYYDAAQAGYAPAQRNLGKCYQHAKGVPQNLTEAVFWYRKAAAEGHYEAMNDLAICCANGLGCPVNHTEAVHWWQQAAAQGNTLSQYNLGICYEFGQGVSPNRAEAVKWYREAARAGYPDAKSALTRLKESW